MSNPFLTVEDVNTTLFKNQYFYWHEIDVGKITTGSDFTGIKLDFCTISRTTGTGGVFTVTIVVDNDLWTKGYYSGVNPNLFSLEGNTIKIVGTAKYPKVFLYIGVSEYENLTRIRWQLQEESLDLNFKQLNTPQRLTIIDKDSYFLVSIQRTLNQGINDITHNILSDVYHCGFLMVNLLKSEFQFNCTQSLIVGQVNKVQLGATADYKPSGDMIGTNTPTINVLYEDELIPVTYDSSVNDYVFDLDLSDKNNEGKIHFKVLIDENKVLNNTEVDVALDSSFETINTLSKLTNLFKNGGVGRLSADITLSADLAVTKSVLLYGNNNTLNLNGHKLIIPNNTTFKAEQTTFNNGVNCISQLEGSKVEITNSTFTNCTSVNGLGAVIDCDIDLDSLDNPTDFTTVIDSCTFSNCDSIILQGGELVASNCDVTGKINNKLYPFFLYQTDGSATLTGNRFRLSSNTQINYDLEFNTCIFVCGETATINGQNHSELQKNNITEFLDTQKNRSIIDVTYYYDAIEDYINLQSSNGYCHAVSDTDYVFKTNVHIERSSD